MSAGVFVCKLDVHFSKSGKAMTECKCNVMKMIRFERDKCLEGRKEKGYRAYPATGQIVIHKLSMSPGPSPDTAKLVGVPEPCVSI